MKVLHLTCNDARTGGARSLHRLHVALMAAGVDSRVLLGAEEDKSESERHISRSFVWRVADKPVTMVADRTGLHGASRPSFRLWRSAIDAFKPDVVHLHWTYAASSIPLMSLRSLSAAYQLVWTFHDMWAFTGGCTNSKGCERWMSGCGSCPILASREVTGAMLSMPRDLTALQWRFKSWALGRTRMTVVAPSAWMADLVRRSPIVRNAEVVVVPNPIDTDVFAPREGMGARGRLGLPVEAKVVLYIGKPDSVFAYEGRVPLLLDTLKLVQADNAGLASMMRLLVVGGRGDDLLQASGYQGVALGPVHDEPRMAECLSATDAMIDTTQYDNLPGVVQEAMSCGVAIVASKVGGLPDMIESGRSGILVDRSSPGAFAEAMETVLTNDEFRQSLGARARATAVERYSSHSVAQAMISVYQNSRHSRATID